MCAAQWRNPPPGCRPRRRRHHARRGRFRRMSEDVEERAPGFAISSSVSRYELPPARRFTAASLTLGRLLKGTARCSAGGLDAGEALRLLHLPPGDVFQPSSYKAQKISRARSGLHPHPGLVQDSLCKAEAYGRECRMSAPKETEPVREQMPETVLQAFYRHGRRDRRDHRLLRCRRIEPLPGFPKEAAFVTVWLETRHAFFRRWQGSAEASCKRSARSARGIPDMTAATASHRKWRDCSVLDAGSEFPSRCTRYESSHAGERAVRVRLRILAGAANARSARATTAAVRDRPIPGPDGPTRTVASPGARAGRGVNWRTTEGEAQ